MYAACDHVDRDREIDEAGSESRPWEDKANNSNYTVQSWYNTIYPGYNRPKFDRLPSSKFRRIDTENTSPGRKKSAVMTGSWKHATHSALGPNR